MGPLDELQLHAQALLAAVETNPKFFAPIIHYVRQLGELTAGRSSDRSSHTLRIIVNRIDAFFREWRRTATSPPGWFAPRETQELDGTVQDIRRLVTTIEGMPEPDMALKLAFGTSPAVLSEPARSPCIFIGHGRSRLWARVKTHLEDDLGIEVLTYESEPHIGQSIVPVLEEFLGKATFAVLILTAEDETKQETRRARQNVVHEAGLFQGRLGFQKAVLLVQEGVETFTNVAGLQDIPFNGENVEQTFYELGRVLRREGQIR